MININKSKPSPNFWARKLLKNKYNSKGIAIINNITAHLISLAFPLINAPKKRNLSLNHKLNGIQIIKKIIKTITKIEKAVEGNLFIFIKMNIIKDIKARKMKII